MGQDQYALSPDNKIQVLSWVSGMMKMKNTVVFGNGINLLSENSISWTDLLSQIKGENQFPHDSLPYTMVYEQIYMGMHRARESERVDELKIKNKIAEALSSQESNDVYQLLAGLEVEHYLTTNYDYAFEKALALTSQSSSSEEIYSLRRKRKYQSGGEEKYLWNIHGEIDNPKSIMLGLDHYCGSVSKIDAYVKGNYKYSAHGESVSVDPMIVKLKSGKFCYTSWVDLFFSSNVHILGLSLDYSETDLWWILNKRARFAADNLIKNNIYYYVDKIEVQKLGLLESFGVTVVVVDKVDGSYESMYRQAIAQIRPLDISTRAA